MNTFLKKHSKTIFAVLGAFLMLTFTLPSVMKNNGDVGSYEVGRLDGKKVPNSEIQSANFEMTILARFGLLGTSSPYLPPELTFSQGLLTITPQFNVRAIPYPIYGNVPVAYLNEAGSSSHDVERGTHWFLLLHEARKFGILADPSLVSEVVASVSKDEDQLRQTLYKAGTTVSEFRTAIADALVIQSYGRLTMRSMPVSIPELEFQANEKYSAVQVDYAVLDAATPDAKVPEPTADQIQKQYELYKDVIATLPGAATPPAAINGHTFPFGYKYGDRVKAEYLKFDRSEVAERFKPTREDMQEAYRYYTQHPDDPDISIPHAESSNFTISTQPSKKTFEQVRDLLVKRQVDDRVNKFLKRITDRVTSITSAPWANAKDAGGFREPIARADWVDYKTIPDTLKKMQEFNGYQPHYGAIASFEDQNQLAREPGIGQAAYDHQGTPFAFPVLATHVHELGDFPDFPRFYLQAGVDGPILKDADGNLYIYRVTDAEKSHAPATVDEVRPQIVEDLKKIATFEQKKADAKKIAEAAAQSDLTKAAKSQNLSVASTPEFHHPDREIPGLGVVPGFVDAAFDLARAQSTTQPASQPSVQNRTTTVNDDAALKVYVLALTKYTPVPLAEFAARRADLVDGMSAEGGLGFAHGWLALDSIAKRLKYVPARPFATK